MEPTAAEECGEILVAGLINNSDVPVIKRIANIIDYNEYPIFGGHGRRLKLFNEMVILNICLILHCIGEVFSADDSKLISEYFLAKSHGPVIKPIEKETPDIQQQLFSRIREYIPLLQSKHPSVEITKAFNKNLKKKANVAQIVSLSNLVQEFIDNTTEALTAWTRLYRAPGNLPTHDSPQLEQQVNDNIAIIKTLTDGMISELYEDSSFKNTQLNHLAETGSTGSKDIILLYMHTIFSICKTRHNSLYIQSREYQRTKEATTELAKIAFADTMSKMTNNEIQPNLDKISYDEDFETLENTIISFANELNKGNTNTPDKALIDWFTLKTGIKSNAGKSIEIITKENLRTIYTLIYVIPD